ncbi:MAG: hypothetical protein JWR61_2596 [Ferruginibacter sp.]|nr:hypothetical protein [Ferruginibacter sp.]
MAPMSQTAVCTIRQIIIDREDNCMPDLKEVFFIEIPGKFMVISNGFDEVKLIQTLTALINE